jgi:cytochrome bd ubiquinol oxidase subunit I
MTLAAFEATGFAVAGIHGLLLLKRPASAFHREAMVIALSVGALAALLQPLSGDVLAKGTAVRQPLKLAAMESHFETARGAPLVVGGIPDAETGTVRFGVEIPGALSFLAHGDFRAEVKGLRDFPRELWPPLKPVHVAFQIMVGCGMALAGLSLAFLVLLKWKPAWLADRRFLVPVVAATPLGFLALEAGWVVTEVGRQPWIIYGIMKTAEAVTPMPGLVYPFLLFTGIYVFLTFTVAWLLWRHIRAVDRDYPSARASHA